MNKRPLSVVTTLVFVLINALFWLAIGVIVVANLHPGFPDLPLIKEITAFLAFATAGFLLILFVLLCKRNRIAYFLGIGLFIAMSLLILLDDFGWTDLVVLIINVVPLILLITDRSWHLQARPVLLTDDEKRK